MVHNRVHRVESLGFKILEMAATQFSSREH